MYDSHIFSPDYYAYQYITDQAKHYNSIKGVM